MTLSQHVGQRIRELREARGISQRKLALVIGEYQPNLCNLEKGKRTVTIRFVERIATFFNVPPSYFFEGFEQ